MGEILTSSRLSDWGLVALFLTDKAKKQKSA